MRAKEFTNYQGVRPPKNVPGTNLFPGQDIVGQRVYHCTNKLEAIKKSGGLKPRRDATGEREYGRLSTDEHPFIPVIGIWFSVGKPDWPGKHCVSFVIEPTDQVYVAYANSKGLKPNVVLNPIALDRLTVEGQQGVAEGDGNPNQQIALYNPDGRTYRGSYNKMPTLDPNDPGHQSSGYRVDPNQSYETDFDKEDLKRVVARGMSGLSDSDKHILELRFWDDLTYNEIAAKLGIPSEEVKSLIAIALRKLKHPKISNTLRPYSQVPGLAEATGDKRDERAAGLTEGLNEFAMDDGDNGEDPTDNYPCYDCGSTIFLHHTKLCDLAEPNAKHDLPARPGSQHWTGEIPKGLNPIPGLQENVAENFADGRNPQDKGDSKRHGINTRASVSSLRKTAKQGGRKGQLAHWLANMKAGRAKANKK
jgi:RNA polymerase sigma factor (sigma-70 family)